VVEATWKSYIQWYNYSQTYSFNNIALFIFQDAHVKLFKQMVLIWFIHWIDLFVDRSIATEPSATNLNQLAVGIQHAAIA